MATIVPKGQPKDFYQDWLKRNFNGNRSRGSKKDFDTVKEVRERFWEMKHARQNNCYWSSFNEVNTNVNVTGGSWDDRWDLQDKAKLMWSLYGAFANGQSNVKTPMSVGRINAFINQCKKMNLSYDALPNSPKDRNAARFASKALDFTEETSGSAAQRIMAYEDAATHGSGFWREVYLVDKCEYRFPKVKDLTKEEEEQYKSGEIVYGEKETKVKYDTPISIYIRNRELYWDPSARTDHGPAYAAQDVIWRQVIPVSEAKARLENIPGAKNIDKVDATKSYIGDSDYNGFFEVPKDTIAGEYVEWLEYENCRKDQYRIIVNDLVCVDTPLPTNHKELSFNKVDYRKINGQFYGKGIIDEVLQLQGSEEVTSNMANDYVWTSYKKKVLVGASASGEVTEDALSGDTSVVVIDDDEGRTDIRSKIHQLVNSPIGFDLFRMIDFYEAQATIASGIDPSQLSLLPQGKTATATLANKEQLEATFGGVIQNFIDGGLSSAAQQRWSLIQQHWKLPRFKDVVGASEEKTMPKRSLRLEGIELKIDDESSDLNISTSEQDFTFFDAEDKYLDTKEALTIRIRPDIKEIQSKAYEQQKVQEALPQLAQFMVDPNNQQQMAQHPFPYINGPKWFAEEYYPKMGYSQDTLITPEQNRELAIKRAEKDVTRILNGEHVAGVPGSSAAHNKYEAQVLFAIQAKIAEMEDAIVEDMDRQAKTMEKEMQNIPPQFDPMTGQPVQIEMPQPEPNPEKVAQVERSRDIWARLSKHLAQDSLPAGLIEEAAMEDPNQGQQQPPQMMGPDVPMPSGQPAMGGMPMDPNMGQMQAMLPPQVQGGMM